MKRESTNTALAFLLGAAAGGIAALLFAPASGAETRRRIRQGIGDLKERGEELFEEAAEEISDRARKVKEAARREAAAFRGAATAAKEAYQEARDRS